VIDGLMSDKPINVLMIIGSLGDGGKERQLLLLLKVLKHHKHITTCLLVMNSGGEKEEEARQFADSLVILPGQRNLNLVKPLNQVTQLIKQNEINIIHTWGSGFWDLMGVIVGRVSHIPVIHNGIRSAPSRLNIYNHLTRFGALLADVTVANSCAGLESFRLKNRPKSRVIHNGLDVSRFDGIQIADEGKKLCMVANFRDAKDHKSVILAMAEILLHHPKSKLFLVGHDYGTLNDCQNFAKKLEIAENVEFVTNCSHPEPIIGNCQVGILATNETVHGEGISNALLEYMALSKPVIASKNGGNAEVVVENLTGFLVEPGISEGISEKAIYLLDNPEIAKKMGDRGKEFVNENFSLARMEKDYMGLYQEFFQ
jgi:glycosyltransferase involved in cell wall biosynthesis